MATSGVCFCPSPPGVDDLSNVTGNSGAFRRPCKLLLSVLNGTVELWTASPNLCNTGADNSCQDGDLDVSCPVSGCVRVGDCQPTSEVNVCGYYISRPWPKGLPDCSEA